MEEAEAAIARGGSTARPNPRAEGKAREAAKQLNSMAKKAARSGARNAAATAFNAAKRRLRSWWTASHLCIALLHLVYQNVM